MKSINEFLAELDKLGIKLWNDKGMLGYRAPKGTLTKKLMSSIKNRKSEILAFLSQQDVEQMPAVTPVSRADEIPMSFGQQRLWFLNRLESANLSYNIAGAFSLMGKINKQALEDSLKQIEERHETLRTTFAEKNGTAYQQINPPSFKLNFLSLEESLANEQSEKIQDLINKEQSHVFSLSNGPLWRVTLLRLNPSKHILLVTFHHIIADGWSLSNFINELSILYEAIVKSQPLTLPELAVQYADYTVCQRSWLVGDVLQKQLNYWQQQLANSPALSTFPTDYPRPPVQRFRGAEIIQSLPQTTVTEIKALAKQQGVTLFMVLEAAFALLLSKYAGAQDVLIGTPIANRQHQEVEPLIGFFVNTLVLRHNLSGNPSFLKFLQQVHQLALNAYQYQSLPFELLVEAIQPERSLSQSPLFQVMFILQNTPPEKRKLADIDLTFMNSQSATSKFDLTVSLEESENRITGIWEYDIDLYKEETIQRIIAHYNNLLNSIISEPDKGIDQLAILDQTEHYQIIYQWNSQGNNVTPNQTVHKMFEVQAEMNPEAVALVFDQQQITYRALNDRANQLAHYLLMSQVGSNKAVGIYCQRSPELIISVIAILKAGFFCVPLDLEYPKERLKYMIDDAKVSIILTQQARLSDWPEYAGLLVNLNDISPALATDNPNIDMTSEELCYVLYTSGSTGQPKGVAMPHQALSNLINWQMEDVKAVNTTQFSPISFDVSFQETFSTLCAGGVLFLFPEALRKDPKALLLYLEEQQIERMFLPVVMLQQLAECAKGKMPLALRRVITAGEQLKITPSIRQWFKNANCILQNQYGPTETHVVSCFTLSEEVDDWPLLPAIGQPVPNTQLYILDSHLQPVPIGVAGELYIGGLQLAKGYFNRPELTDERFLPNPFGEGKIYKTGDICKYQANGNIDYIGRIDSQIKMRGFRIELEEIEQVLEAHQDISKAVVLIDKEKERLIAYLTGHFDSGSITHYLTNKLPQYMIPSVFLKLDNMPLTPSGKIDRKTLSAMEISNTRPSDQFTPPVDFIEQQLANIWQEVLALPMVGVEENFFAIGGHSLLAVHLMARIEQHFGKNLPVATLFQCPTIRAMSDRLRTQQVHSSWTSLVPIRTSDKTIPFFFVPGAGGNVLYIYEMSRLLHQDQAIYGLQAKGLDGTAPYSSIEEMAAYYIKAVKSVQANGPYIIGGHSFGARVAFEMTQQLAKNGEAIAQLIVIDADAPSEEHHINELDGVELLSFFLQIYGDLIKRRPEISTEKLREIIDEEQRLQYVSEQMKAVGLIPKNVSVSELKNIINLFKTNLTIKYLPKDIIKIPITFFRAEEGIKPIDPIWGQDQSLGWHDLSAKSIEMITLPGDHYSIFTHPYVEDLSLKLSQCLVDVTKEVKRHVQDSTH